MSPWPNGRPLSKPEWPTKEEQALTTLIAAGEMWVNEIEEYILTDPLVRSDPDSVEARELEVKQIREAIQTLKGEV